MLSYQSEKFSKHYDGMKWREAHRDLRLGFDYVGRMQDIGRTEQHETEKIHNGHGGKVKCC